MDVLRQLPIGQFVAGESGRSCWLQRLDARLKFGWTLAFLLTPILAGPLWRVGLVLLLLLVTACSGLPWRRQSRQGRPCLLYTSPSPRDS